MPSQIPWENNWNRTYKITLGVREFYKADYIIPSTIVSPFYGIPENNGDTIPSDAFEISNLEDPRGFTFEFDSQQVASDSSASNERTTLTLHNLSEEAKRVLLLPNCICILECGYEGKTTKCYTGDVVSVTPSRNLPDISYRIQLASQGNAVRNTMINTTYDESISKKDIILDMAKRFPATSIATYGLDDLRDKYKTGGLSASGELIAYWETMMRMHNLEYFISNNKMYIIPFRIKGKDYDDFARTNYTLDEDSIKYVTESLDNTGKSDDETQNKIKKLQINTFYLPIDVGQFVTIPTTEYLKDYAGTYIVKGRRIVLQSKGNAWDVVLDVEELSQ